jgi:hypothetical protein
VVVKKTFGFSNVFFYNHLYRNSLCRNINSESGVNSKGPFLLKCVPHCGNLSNHIVLPFKEQAHGIPHGQQRVHPSPQETEQDPKANGPTARNLYKGYPQLRTGMAISAGLCGTTDVFPSIPVGG